MLRIFVVLWSCILMSCDSAETGAASALKLNFHGTSLSMPSRYVLPALPASITSGGGGLDEGEGISLKIPLSDIGYDVVSDRGLVGNIVVLLTPLSQSARDARVSADVQNAWKGLDLYINRIIERDDVVNMYRVYSKAGYPKLWNYFRVEPDGSTLDPKNWVGNCMVGPLDQQTSNLSNVTCKTLTAYKNVQIELSYSGVHLLSLDTLAAKLLAQISAWDVSPSSRF
jgi:hypothetical protein